MMTTLAIQDDGQFNKYFHLSLHCDDDDLNPYEYRLIGHYKRVCGTMGACYEAIKTTATKCQMSIGKVRAARKSLRDKGLLQFQVVTPGSTNVLRIVDRMAVNVARYAPPIKNDSPPLSDSIAKEEPYKEEPVSKVLSTIPSSGNPPKAELMTTEVSTPLPRAMAITHPKMLPTHPPVENPFKTAKTDPTDLLPQFLKDYPDSHTAKLHKKDGTVPSSVDKPDKRKLKTADKTKPVKPAAAETSNVMRGVTPDTTPLVNAAKRPNPSQKSKVPRNPIFDWVASELFNVAPEDVKASTGRIVKICSLIINVEKEHLKLVDKQALPGEMSRALADKLAHPQTGFVAFYHDKYPNASLPLGTDTFGTAYDQWRANGNPLLGRSGPGHYEEREIEPGIFKQVYIPHE